MNLNDMPNFDKALDDYIKAAETLIQEDANLTTGGINGLSVAQAARVETGLRAAQDAQEHWRTN